MRTFPFLFTVCLLLIGISCSVNNSQSSKISVNDANGIVVVGGTLISGMEEHPYFELYLNHIFPNNEVRVRNIGWPADDVFGLARSQFGSAQNTQSWKPPSKEEGFGSKVLLEHIEETHPKVLLIGYGPETAYYDSEEEFELFESGYLRLIEDVQEKTEKIILITPPKQELTIGKEETITARNTNLSRTSNFISKIADERKLTLIDLHEELIQEATANKFTTNGVHLNSQGYERMGEILCDKLNLIDTKKVNLELDDGGNIVNNENCSVSDWSQTVNGYRFTLTPDKLSANIKLKSNNPIAIYVNGQIQKKSLDTINTVTLHLDSLQQARLVNTIKEKNRLYRYRLRPLNEAYIYLFRKHEMGHLAYEMDDLLSLVKEKDYEIQQLKQSQSYFVEIETIKPWNPPKTYADDEVPNFIPEPNVEAELAAFRISDEFELNLFAKDPMIANPINVNWDTKGRAWVATSSTYPHIVPGREPNDKIIILEDTDNDGQADKHTVFAENLLVPHSVMPVPGGAYVVATTQLLYLEDTDGDDVADKTHVVFDGFGNADVHHTIHGLRWTPWGDLHFTQSIYINTFVETINGPRVLNGSGIWSFSPETQELEIYSRGLVNPWGEALDEWGQTFATDGAGSSGINYVFPESAHATAVGANSVLNGLNQGTPKNTAAEFIYSNHFPKSWQGSIITNDYRANRTVRYQIQPSNSGYQSEEEETVLTSEHRSYRPVDSKIGPDGALYIVDWYNPIIDHGEVDFHHPVRDKTHGRIWRLSHKGSKKLRIEDLEELSLEELLEKLQSDAQVTRILANRVLVERKVPEASVKSWIAKLNKSKPNYHRSFLEGVWLMAALDVYDEELLSQALKSRNYHVRGAAVRLVGHYSKQKDFAGRLKQMILDANPQVRLETLHALREMRGSEAADISSLVLEMPMDENIDFTLSKTLSELHPDWIKDVLSGKSIFNSDPNKLMYALLTIENEQNIPMINELLSNETVVDSLKDKAWQLLAKIGDVDSKTKVVTKAIQEEDLGLLRTLAYAPDEFDAVPNDLTSLATLINSDSLAFKLLGLRLAGRWNVIEYESEITDVALHDEELRAKVEALRALYKLDITEEVIQWAKSHDDEQVRGAANIIWIESEVEDATDNAVAYLQQAENVEAAELVFATFRRQEKGPELLESALKGKKLSEEIASAGLRIIQTSGLNLSALDKVVREAGQIKSIGLELTSEEKKQLISDAIEDGNTNRGRGIYRRKELMCGSCHQVDKEGGLSGPYLGKIGSFMTPEAMLEALISQSSVSMQYYETVIVTKKSGEVVNGILHRKTANATLIRQANSQIEEIPNNDISNTDVSPNSLMPPGLTANLHKDELRDLLAYLMSLGK